MKTETKEHEINHVSETAERVEPTAAEIQARHDRSKSLCLISENPEDDADIDISELNAWIKAFNVQRRDRGILLKRLTAAEELNDDQAHRLGKLEQGIQKYLDGDEPVKVLLRDHTCKHGYFKPTNCTQCIDDYFAALLKGART